MKRTGLWQNPAACLWNVALGTIDLGRQPACQAAAAAPSRPDAPRRETSGPCAAERARARGRSLSTKCQRAESALTGKGARKRRSSVYLSPGNFGNYAPRLNVSNGGHREHGGRGRGWRFGFRELCNTALGRKAEQEATEARNQEGRKVAVADRSGGRISAIMQWQTKVSHGNAGFTEW